MTKKPVKIPETWIARTRINIRPQKRIIEKGCPFPLGVDGVDYDRLKNEKLIMTLDEFQKVGIVCLTCPD